jgi:hypothetical protein
MYLCAWGLYLAGNIFEKTPVGNKSISVFLNEAITTKGQGRSKSQDLTPGIPQFFDFLHFALFLYIVCSYAVLIIDQ